MDWVGWDGMDGIGSPGGRGYRAPYGANNQIKTITFFMDSEQDSRLAGKVSGTVPYHWYGVQKNPWMIF